MFERFTERARRVIILAREEAGRFRHDFVGTEHILLGLIRDGEGIATAVLQRLGLKLETVKTEVERALAGLLAGPRLDPTRQVFLREVKAVSHHDLDLDLTPGRCRCRVTGGRWRSRSCSRRTGPPAAVAR